MSRPGERPRDALGRPLPHGETGVPPLASSAPLPPAAALAEAQRLLDAGLPFQAHEVLEAVWKSPETDPGERGLWRGLAQLAVGVTHLARGNVKGGVAVLRRGAANLIPYADRPPHGVAVPGLLAWVDLRIADIGRAHPGLPCITARTAPADGGPRLVG
ncbi:hypothetical protein CcI156_11095 [Frankia sp. CcI156]|uniref:DUF309 domain-containing protein n=1 Tax=Frankia casuarinae (strain DSM 45818 / CECT 9043 / HFP020203 / CcI3) TaxID=106370 RepID=Q2J8P1_FRACC|nr:MULTISPECIES: DUF309 domain-containing protein [Frankia]ABD12351.1 protein of unknown function DUF309 [Frankia casuarinae]ETA02383.1 hypothetical protein CcI6DRAFT_02177 [Frankia sp. CcI6]EYT91547.1 hypothetical protein ThrDRAFT_02785 [Frankia casuarinae]KDA44827.1 hypothetical protein BMG523Draft_00350 [Frankia sp. BMG5.23]OHV55114.1 hypothetical protein CgIS1_11260 [Frankia sp. CgIS1]